MEWTERQMLDALRFIEESDYDEVRLETEGFRLHVRKSGAPAALDEPRSAAGGTSVDEFRTGSAPQTGVQRRASAAEPVSPAAPEVQVPQGMIAVRAPMIGTFYRAPAPHLPPFVDVGASVRPEDTVCLIEVMKLFNTIKAGVAGKIVKIAAQNAATVQRDEVLLIIEPKSS